MDFLCSRRVDKNHLVSKKHPEGKGQIPPPRPVIYVRHSEESPPRSNHRKRSAAQSFPPFLYVVPQKLLSRNQKGAPKTRGCSVLPGPSFALRNDVDPGESIIWASSFLRSMPHKHSQTWLHFREKSWLVSIAFPLNNFKHYFTLFSKFFPSFPHGTCSLSVSRQYLALDGVYHPLRAAFPSNLTLW